MLVADSARNLKVLKKFRKGYDWIICRAVRIAVPEGTDHAGAFCLPVKIKRSY